MPSHSAPRVRVVPEGVLLVSIVLFLPPDQSCVVFVVYVLVVAWILKYFDIFLSLFCFRSSEM